MHMYSKDLDKENLYGMEATSPDSNWMKPFKSQINHISMILLTQVLIRALPFANQQALVLYAYYT